jgi:hypothetical protein
MPVGAEPLKNPRQEAFARARAAGKTLEESMESAGYKVDRPNASRLTTYDNVNLRIAHLQSLAAEKTVVTAESLILEAEEVRQLAIKGENYSAAVAAIREKGQLSGLRIDRHLVKAQVSELNPSDMTDEELHERLCELDEQLCEDQLEKCKQLGLDPATATLEAYWATLAEYREESAARRARDVSSEPYRRAPPPRPSRYFERPPPKKDTSGRYGGPQDALSTDNRRAR